MKIVASALAFTMLLAGTAASQTLSEADRKAIVADVIKHFRENPQELVEAIVSWREKEAAALRQAAVPTSGNPAGDVTIFEFPDYGCEPCRKLSAAVDHVAAKDGKVRVVHHDHPSSGQDAVAAALDLLAAHASGKDWSALRRAYIAQGVAPEYRIKALDAASINIPSESRASGRDVLVTNRALAAKAGIADLPAIIVSAGGKVQALSGALTAADVEAAVRRLREAVASGR